MSGKKEWVTPTVGEGQALGELEREKQLDAFISVVITPASQVGATFAVMGIGEEIPDADLAKTIHAMATLCDVMAEVAYHLGERDAAWDLLRDGAGKLKDRAMLEAALMDLREAQAGGKPPTKIA